MKTRKQNRDGSDGEKISDTSRYNTKSFEDLIKLKDAKSQSEHNFSNLFFSIGLCLSLLFVITAFEWKFYDRGQIMDLGMLDSDFENVVEIPPTVQPPPPVRKIEQPKIIEVPDEEEILEDIKIDLDIEMTEDQVIEQRIFEDMNIDVEKEEVADEIFTIVENQPEPKGGMSAFYEYVGKNLKYPVEARRNNIEGRVYIEFVVEKDGSLTDVRILKGIGGGCDQEAIRIIENAPKWIPGKQRGRPVRVKMVLPIYFKLQIY
jgi:periplasmic protein TonB